MLTIHMLYVYHVSAYSFLNYLLTWFDRSVFSEVYQSLQNVEKMESVFNHHFPNFGNKFSLGIPGLKHKSYSIIWCIQDIYQEWFHCAKLFILFLTKQILYFNTKYRIWINMDHDILFLIFFDFQFHEHVMVLSCSLNTNLYPRNIIPCPRKIKQFLLSSIIGILILVKAVCNCLIWITLADVQHMRPHNTIYDNIIL